MVSYSSVCIYWKWPASLQRIQPFVVIFSCFLLNLVYGSFITFGNLLPYIVSYIRERSYPEDLRLTDTTFVFAAQMSSIGCTMILGGILDRYTGPRVVIICSGFVMSFGVAISYFTVQYSFWLFLLSYGVVYGVGIGISYMSIISCAVKWMPKWKGLVSGFVLSGIGISPFIFNAIQTGFINPGNRSPDYSPYLHETYFTQPDVLDRVPFIFLLLSLCYITVISFGSIFVALPYPKESNNQDQNKQDNSYGEIIQLSSITDKRKQISDKKEQISDKQKPAHEKEVRNFSPLQMLKEPRFYHIGIMLVIGLTINSFMLSLYKSYGFEEVTGDDHFLTVAGSTSAVFNFLGHIVWGVLADITDYKFGITVHCAYITCILFTFYSTAFAGQIMYFFWLCGLFFGIGGYFSLFPVATAECFGHKFLATNYGILVGTAQVIGSVSAALISHTLLYFIHWYGVFFFVGGLSSIQYILSFFLHSCKNKQ